VTGECRKLRNDCVVSLYYVPGFFALSLLLLLVINMFSDCLPGSGFVVPVMLQ
jgi:hypothetical protein